MMDYELTIAIMERAEDLGIGYERMTMAMDLDHADIDGTALLEFTNADFAHDIAGIQRFTDRVRGELTNCFVPRSTKQITVTKAITMAEARKLPGDLGKVAPGALAIHDEITFKVGEKSYRFTLKKES